MKHRRTDDLDKLAADRRNGFILYVASAVVVTVFMWWVQS